jgi:hypothetical protein
MLSPPRALPVFALASLLALALSAPRALAQCGPDGLDGGPCCQPAGVMLPQFPPMSQGVRFICFDNCQTVTNVSYCVNLGQPIPYQAGGAIVCGVYRIRVTVKSCASNTTLWNGSVLAHYSRNWQESSVPGAINLNVWRFVVNGDFLPTAAVPNNPFFKPACLSTYTRVYFTGYFDYAFDCFTGQWQVAWAVDHECDGIHHAPGTSRPAPAAGLHPTTSFTFVGPDAGFVVAPASMARSNGPIVQQALRWNNWANLPAICNFEEPAQGNFQALNDFCMCGTAAGAHEYIATNVTAVGGCGSSVNPSTLGIFMQKRIGRWTNPGVFPGTETLLIDFGYLNNMNGCTGASTQEWFEGAETLRGYPAFDFAGVALGLQFEDLGSANKSATLPAVHIGAPHVTYYLLNFNLP